jgi:hypothetical protein
MSQFFHFFEQIRALHVAVENVLKHCDFVSVNFLLNLQNVHAHRELFNLTTTDSVD